jgi:hypothetical protein
MDCAALDHAEGRRQAVAVTTTRGTCGGRRGGMMKRIEHRLSPATVIALIALFVALGGVGVAATGGNFILGQSNTAGATTALKSGVTTGPTLDLANIGGRAAARFTSDSNVQPFTVSNSTKIGNLNADRLDGIDSTGFAQGKNVQFLSARVTTPIDPNFPFVPIITVPGFGTLKGQCPNFNGVYDGFFHTSSTGWADFYQTYDGTPFTTYYAGGGSFTQLQAGDGGGGHITYVLLQGSGTSATTAVIDLYTNWDANNGCLFRPQVMISQGG